MVKLHDIKLPMAAWPSSSDDRHGPLFASVPGTPTSDIHDE
jgi:hypothetical protein